MKVGIITYHAAHNYGSNLQAYALQKIVSNIGFDCEIINFRTLRQKDQYTPFTKRKGMKYLIKNAYFALNYGWRKQKYVLFEKFISQYLVKSKEEYSTLAELEQYPFNYDYYISGSDQIWNTVPNDFDMAYYLPFVKTGKRIAYAPSFGQIGNISHIEEIKTCLLKYDAISVREENGVRIVKELTGIEPPVVLDPTLLLPKEEWEKLIGSSLIQHRYIFFYTLFATKEMIMICKKISKAMKLPVVISNISNQYEIISGFQKMTKAGPLEFLNLIKYADLVISSSFHGTVFSILLERPFYSINGMSDMRIRTLLTELGLECQSIDSQNVNDFCGKIKKIDFTQVKKD